MPCLSCFFCLSRTPYTQEGETVREFHGSPGGAVLPEYGPTVDASTNRHAQWLCVMVLTASAVVQTVFARNLKLTRAV